MDAWVPGLVALLVLLAERRSNSGKQLSGGEQQMLAIGRALMTNPKLLILDEATEGLAPLIREEIWTVLEKLKAEGQSILIVDKNIDALSRFADRHVVIEKGKVGETYNVRGYNEMRNIYVLDALFTLVVEVSKSHPK